MPGERGQTILIVALSLAALVIVLLVLVINTQTLVMVHQTVQECLELAVQAGTAAPVAPGGQHIPSTAAAVVRRVLQSSLAGIPLLAAAPDQVDIAIVHPAAGQCAVDPYSSTCYRRPFISAQMAVPIRVFWGTQPVKFNFQAAAMVRDLPGGN